MEYTEYDTRLAAYGLVTEGDRVLLALWNGTEPGSWTMPGGGVEIDESPEQAVVRELLEETGYEVAVGPLLGVRTHVVPPERRLRANGRAMKAVQVVYRVSVVGGSLRNEEAGSTDEARWIPIGEVPMIRHVALVGASLAWAGCGRETGVSPR
jgi:8-oxo-dGTP diphosphatase